MTTKSAVLAAIMGATFLSLPAPLLAQWSAPIGVPTPSFGINEIARARPASWTAEVAGYYYVDATVGASTDSQTYGYPARPRRTIPEVLPAGSVVEVRGTYNTAHLGNTLMQANGTAAQPVFIRGIDAANAPTFTRPLHMQGSYFIVENISFRLDASVSDANFKFISPTHHAAIRSSKVEGNLTGGGVRLSYNPSFGGGEINNVVVYKNEIFKVGDVNSTADQDAHAMSVSPFVNTSWIVDNTMHDCSGDGLQINAGSASNQASLHHIYVGRNHVYRTRQAGLFAKQSTDIVFSQNTVHDIIDTDWSRAKALGFQYAPERVWFLYNRVYNVIYGIYAGSDSGLGTGSNTYMIGNVIYNVHHAAGESYTGGTAWDPAAIMLAGGINRTIVNNTIYNVDSGISIPSSGGTLFMENNVIDGITEANGRHVFVEFGAVASRSTLHHSLFGGPLKIRWGGSSYSTISSFQSGSGTGAGSVSADPRFLSLPNLDFHLAPDSPARNSGSVASVYEDYRLRYGVSITRDIEGAGRPVAGVWDMGAYEFGGSTTSIVPPLPPANVHIIR